MMPMRDIVFDVSGLYLCSIGSGLSLEFAAIFNGLCPFFRCLFVLELAETLAVSVVLGQPEKHLEVAKMTDWSIWW